MRFAAGCRGHDAGESISLEQLGLSPLAAVLAGQRPGRGGTVGTGANDCGTRRRRATDHARDRTVALLDAPRARRTPDPLAWGRSGPSPARGIHVDHHPSRGDGRRPRAAAGRGRTRQPDDVELPRPGRRPRVPRTPPPARRSRTRPAAPWLKATSNCRTALLTAAGFGVDGAVPPPATGRRGPGGASRGPAGPAPDRVARRRWSRPRPGSTALTDGGGAPATTDRPPDRSASGRCSARVPGAAAVSPRGQPGRAHGIRGPRGRPCRRVTTWPPEGGSAGWRWSAPGWSGSPGSGARPS